LIAVDNGVSGKILPDGTESNLIQKNMTWWQAQLETAFNTSVINIDRQLFIKKGQIKQITSQDKGTFIGCRNQ
jgi:hypothetical protein